jgi:hypothetical protein
MHTDKGFQRYIGQVFQTYQFPENLSDPSPLLVLTLWMTVAVVLTGYRELYNTTRGLDIAVAGSICSAFILGVLESASLRTILLTHLPWCLALGLAVRIFGSAAKLASTSARKERGSSTSKNPYQDSSMS